MSQRNDAAQGPLSWGEFLAIAERPRSVLDVSSCASRESDGISIRWAGGSFEEAVKLAKSGCPALAAEMVRDAAGIAVPVKSIVVSKLAVSGNFPRVDRFVAGRPDSMVRLSLAKVRKPQGITRIFVSLNYPANTEHGTIRRYGLAVLGAIYGVERKGGRCEVVGVSFTKDSCGSCSDYHALGITLKRADQPLDMDRLAFALAHPSMLRRLIFAVREELPDAMRRGHYSAGGYGYTAWAPERWSLGQAGTAKSREVELLEVLGFRVGLDTLGPSVTDEAVSRWSKAHGAAA